MNYTSAKNYSYIGFIHIHFRIHKGNFPYPFFHLSPEFWDDVIQELSLLVTYTLFKGDENRSARTKKVERRSYLRFMEKSSMENPPVLFGFSGIIYVAEHYYVHR